MTAPRVVTMPDRTKPQGTLYHEWRVSVDLGFWNRKPKVVWRLTDKKGLPFQVRLVTYSGRPYVTAVGTAIKVDGSMGVNDRLARVPWAEVPDEIKDAIREAVEGFQCDVGVAE